MNSVTQFKTKLATCFCQENEEPKLPIKLKNISILSKKLYLQKFQRDDDFLRIFSTIFSYRKPNQIF